MKQKYIFFANSMEMFNLMNDLYSNELVFHQ